MQIQYFKEYSQSLQRDMEYKIYGHAGKICLVIPTQNNRFHEWEWRHMYDTVQDEIEQERFVLLRVIRLIWRLGRIVMGTLYIVLICMRPG